MYGRIPFHRLFVLFCSFCMLTWAAASHAFPDRPVTIVAPYAPGGTVDILSRAVASELSNIWGQPVVVENRPGGGTTIGTAHVARAAPDGHTILLTSMGYTINRILMDALPYSPEDLSALNIVATAPNVLYVHPSVPATDLASLIELGKKAPQTLSFASSGNGSSLHMAAELFATETGIDILHIPYKGAGPATIDVLGGRVTGFFDTTLQSMQYAKEGKLKAIAVAASQRMALHPQLPTFAESGYPDIETSTWVGFMVPAATPAAVQEKLFNDIQTALQSRPVLNSIANLGFEPALKSQAEFTTFLEDEYVRWERVIKERGISLN